jgi:hypothetical protein
MRLKYALFTLVTMLIGLASRAYATPNGFVLTYVGDAIWASMVYWLIRFVIPHFSTKTSTLYALSFCYSIEISQLYQADWLNAIRHTRLGGLVLGFGFLWSDFVCYTVGIAAAYFLDILLKGKWAKY